MKVILSIFSILFFLSGCRAKPKPLPYTLKKGQRIGYYIDIPKYPAHGYADFWSVENDKVTIIKDDWHLDDILQEKIFKGLQEYKLINLAEHNISKQDIDELFQIQYVDENGTYNRHFIVNPEKRNSYQKLKDLDLDAFIAVYNVSYVQQRGLGTMGLFPGIFFLPFMNFIDPFTMPQYGIFREPIGIGGRYKLALFFLADVFLLDNSYIYLNTLPESLPYKCSQSGYGSQSLYRVRLKTIEQDIDSDTKTLNQEQLNYFKIPTQKYISDMGDRIVECLTKQ